MRSDVAALALASAGQGRDNGGSQEAPCGFRRLAALAAWQDPCELSFAAD